MRIILQKFYVLIIVIFFMLSMSSNIVVASTNTVTNLDDLYVEIGDCIMKAQEGDWDSVNSNIETFKQQWEEIRNANSKKANGVDENLEALLLAITQSEKNPSQISDLLSSLSKALGSYDQEQNPVDNEQGKENIKQLLPAISAVEKDIQLGKFDEGHTKYKQFLTKWTSNEVIVRNQSVVSYGEIETQLAFLRIALTQNPPNKQKALTSIQDLRTAFDRFLSGESSKQVANEDYELNDVITLLKKSMEELDGNHTKIASGHLNQVLIIWPVVEGEVRTRNHELYNLMENNIPAAISLLNSQKTDVKRAKTIISDLYEGLQLIASKTSYTFVDALLILLREGLEAILIIAGLVAFLKKTNHGDKQVWIWSGVILGVIASAILAVCIHIFFSTITAATSREYLEGVIGIVAVVMMLTVGAWLHKKTNINNWNQYIKENLGKALAKGSLISMAILSFLSIFREGAETIIFYTGMAPSIEVNQLVLGIVIALFILVILGFVIIRYSTVIPIRPFFVLATMLIYVLSFKMLGVSIHALQIANAIPTHSLQQVPYIEFIGLYPTMETIITQLILLLVVLATTFYIRKRTSYIPITTAR